MHLLITRPTPYARETLIILERMGHTGILAPVIEIEPTLIPAPPSASIANLIITSQSVLIANGQLDPFKSHRVLAIGQKTAHSLKEIGFCDVQCVGKRSDDLIASLRENRPASSSLANQRTHGFLWVTGEHHQPDFAPQIKDMGHTMMIWCSYRARALDLWPSAIVEALRAQPPEAILHYSLRSAALSLHLARTHKLISAFQASHHMCLSQNIADFLIQEGIHSSCIRVAMQPDEEGLLSALASIGLC